MSAQSYCEGSSNNLLVYGEQHGQPQPLIHVEFVMPPVSNSFSVVGKERKRQCKEVTTSSGFKLPYFQIQTCLRYSVDFLLPLQFWLSESQELFCSECLLRPLHSGLAIFVNIWFSVFSLHNWDEYDSPRSLTKIGMKNVITDGFSKCRWGKIEDYYLLKCPFSFKWSIWCSTKLRYILLDISTILWF